MGRAELLSCIGLTLIVFFVVLLTMVGQPVLKQNIEPALQPVKRELVLVVDYVPGNPLSVHLSRKRNFAAEIPDAKEIVIDLEVTHSKHFRIETQTQRGPATVVNIPRDYVELDCREKGIFP